MASKTIILRKEKYTVGPHEKTHRFYDVGYDPFFIFVCASGIETTRARPFSDKCFANEHIRENRFFGFGFALTVMLDDEIICGLRAGEYVTFAVEPGFTPWDYLNQGLQCHSQRNETIILSSELLMTNLDLRSKELTTETEPI